MKMKQNKGITMVDLVIAIMILSLMVGVIGNLFYQSYYYSTSITMNAYATSYAINILEWTDRLPYEEVTDELNTKIQEKFNMPKDVYTVEMTVEKYSDTHAEKQDIIKIVKVNIKYKLNNKEESFSLKKLKVREM